MNAENAVVLDSVPEQRQLRAGLDPALQVGDHPRGSIAGVCRRLGDTIVCLAKTLAETVEPIGRFDEQARHAIHVMYRPDRVFHRDRLAAFDDLARHADEALRRTEIPPAALKQTMPRFAALQARSARTPPVPPRRFRVLSKGGFEQICHNCVCQPRDMVPYSHHMLQLSVSVKMFTIIGEIPTSSTPSFDLNRAFVNLNRAFVNLARAFVQPRLSVR
jgi:hypothetical protein